MLPIYFICLKLIVIEMFVTKKRDSVYLNVYGYLFLSFRGKNFTLFYRKLCKYSTWLGLKFVFEYSIKLKTFYASCRLRMCVMVKV